MTRIQRLTERVITFALAEPNEQLAVTQVAFLADGDQVALNHAIEACLDRGDRTLYVRWRAIGFLARTRYPDQLLPHCRPPQQCQWWQESNPSEV